MHCTHEQTLLLAKDLLMTNSNPFPQKATFSFKTTKTAQSLSPFYSPPHSSIIIDSFCVLPVQIKLDYSKMRIWIMYYL